MSRIRVIYSIAVFFIAFILTGCGGDSDTGKSFVEVENRSGVTMTYFNGGGVSLGSIYAGQITDKVEVSTGQITFTWSFGGTEYSLVQYINKDYTYDVEINDAEGGYQVITGPNE